MLCSHGVDQLWTAPGGQNVLWLVWMRRRKARCAMALEESSAGCCFTTALCSVMMRIIYYLLHLFTTESSCFSMPGLSGLAELLSVCWQPAATFCWPRRLWLGCLSALGWFVPWAHLLVSWTPQKGKDPVQNQSMAVFFLALGPGTSGECQDFLVRGLA